MDADGAYNILYQVIGREDGRWVVKAFDRSGRQIGVSITCNTPSDCWKIWMMLNGYSYEALGVDPDESMKEAV